MAIFYAASDASELNFWDNLLQGSAGAVISILGIVIAYLLTRSHDHKQLKKQHEHDEKSQRIRESAESVAHVVQVALPFERSENSLNDADKCRELAHRLLVLGFSLTHYYPNMRRWTLYKSDILVRLSYIIESFDENNIELYLIGEEKKIMYEQIKLAGLVPDNIYEDLSPASFLVVLRHARRKAVEEFALITGKLTLWAEEQFSIEFDWSLGETELAKD